MPRYTLLLVVGSLQMIGCGQVATSKYLDGRTSAPQIAAAVEATAANSELVAIATLPFGNDIGEESIAAKVERKIIYTGNMELVVKEFESVPDQIDRLVSEHDGYVADFSVNGSSGDKRSGSWTLRIPVNRFGDFIRAAGKLGQIVQKKMTSREVTAEYFDAQARVDSKRQEETRLIQHLKESTAKLDEILAIEKELSRVRGEIEQMECQLRLFANLSALSTLTLIVQEVQEYVAPAPFSPPTFGERISTTWQETQTEIISAGQSFVLAAVRLGPWFVAAAFALLPFAAVTRMLGRRKATAS